MRTFLVTTEAQLVARACLPRNREWIVLQNDSDADMFLCFDGSGTVLTAANGIRLVAGGILTLENTVDRSDKANLNIFAIHGGSGDKTLRIQERAANGNALATL